MVRLLLACLLVVVLGGPGYAGLRDVFTLGGWSGRAFTLDSGEFSYCEAYARYERGDMMIFRVNRNYNWQMGFYDPAGRLSEGQVLQFFFKIDDQQTFPVEAVALRNDLVLLKFEDSSALFARFRRGQQLKITTLAGIHTYSLAHTSQVLPALVNCVTSGLTGGQNPSAAQAAKPPSNHATRAEAATFAANLLSQAGTVGFSLLGPDVLDKLKVDAAWRTKNVLGTVNVAPGFAAQHVPPIVIGAAAKSCKGTFFSGSLPDEGSMSARVFTTCQAGKDSLTVYYLSVPRRAGGIYLIAIASTVGEQPAKETDADIRKAVHKIQ